MVYNLTLVTALLWSQLYRVSLPVKQNPLQSISSISNSEISNSCGYRAVWSPPKFCSACIVRSLYPTIGCIEPFSDPLQIGSDCVAVVCGMFRAAEEIQKPSETKSAKALITPSSSFVKFSVEMVAPVAQGAWLLGSPTVRRERVRSCRGRRGADGVVGADGRSRGLLAPPQCVEDDAYVGLLFGAHTRVSAFRGCAARRPRPEGLLPIETPPPSLATARRSACDLPFRPMFLLALMRFQSRPLSSARRARSQRFPSPPPSSSLCLLILSSLASLVPSRRNARAHSAHHANSIVESCLISLMHGFPPFNFFLQILPVCPALSVAAVGLASVVTSAAYVSFRIVARRYVSFLTRSARAGMIGMTALHGKAVLPL